MRGEKFTSVDSGYPHLTWEEEEIFYLISTKYNSRDSRGHDISIVLI